MAEEGKMREERTPILGREVSKPLRLEEYPSEEEIASLTGEVGASRLETVLRTMGVAAPVLTVPLLVACREIPETPPPVVRTPEEAGVTPSPTLRIETPTPTEKPVLPTPTVVERAIGTIPRELGGAESEIFSVSFKGETQQGILNKFPDGEQWFLLGVYPDLPEIEEKVDFTNEAVGYDGEVFLTAIPNLADHPNAHPFYQKEPEEGFPNGVLLYIEDGEIVERVDPFTQLQEGEISVRFNSEKGVYEFLDEEENVARTIEVFTVPALTPTPTKEPIPTPEKPVEMVATGNVDIYLSPDGQKVGYFVPGQRFTPTGVEQNGWIQVIDSDGNRLWIQEGGSYGPAGEATPIPEHICPVDPTETPARTNGWIIDRGEQLVIIHEGYEYGPTTRITSAVELFLFGGPIGRQTPERWVFGGRIISFNHQTGEGILSHQGREYRLQFTPQTGYALTKDTFSGWWWADPCQFKAGHMVHIWKYGPFSQTEMNEVIVIDALE